MPGFPSLALDENGIPVIAYALDFGQGLVVLHCGDPTCTADNTSTIAEETGRPHWPSLRLDASGNPVVSYANPQSSGGHPKVLHCGNPTCTSGDTIVSPDTLTSTGSFTSLVLDASGNPVVSYYDTTNDDLKVLHCGDPACTSGNTIATPDTGGDVGGYTSLALDASGNPVVSYYDFTNGDLKVLHCANPFCTLGNTITSPDTDGDVGRWTSLVLDASGNPVVSYYDTTNDDLKVLHCGSPTCAAAKPTPSSTPPPTAAQTVAPTPLPTPTPKDPNGDTDGDTIPNSADVDDDNDGCTDEQELQPKSAASTGGGRDPHNFWDFFDPNRDRAVSTLDFFALLQRFSAVGDPGIDPKSDPPPPPAYHTRFDRGAVIGPNPWNVGPPDGAIALGDFFSLLVQFGHSCA